MKLRVAAVAAIVLLVGCGSTEPEPAPEPAPEVVEGEGLVKPWGAEVELGGLVVVLERPEPYGAEWTGDVPQGWETMLLPVTVTNAGDVPVSSWSVYFGGPQVEEFMEYDGSEYVRPSGDILPGKSIEWLQPIAVEDSGSITVQVDHGEGKLNIEATAYVGDDS